MADWFSNGIAAMAGAFGGAAASNAGFQQQNPFTGQNVQLQSRTNPFSGSQAQMGRGNPFAGGMPGTSGYTGYGTYTADNPIAQFERRASERLGQFGQSFGSNYAGGYSMGQAMPTGSWFAGGRMDNASGYINSASAKYGVPANLLKAMIARESSGDWEKYGNSYVSSRGEGVFQYVGIYGSTARSWGFDPAAMMGNQALQIEAMAKGLRIWYDKVGADYGWEGVISTYFSGRPDQSYTPGDSDGTSTSQYVREVTNWWRQLDEASGAGGYNMNPGSGGGGGAYQIWQGDFPITQEHGPTPFSQGAGAWMYGYAASVGVNGHPGIDVGMPSGTRLYAPASGTVVIAGGSGYYTDHRGDGPGRGELRIELDNGDIVILGHMASISLVPGQRIQAGAYVGTSGSYNGDHLHYEVRRRTPGATSSGYTAVDPRQYFGGGSVAMMNGGSAFGLPQTPQQNGGLWWMRPPSDLFRR